MSDDHNAPERATIRLVYDLVDDLRRDVNAQFSGLDDKFESLRNAIESLREEIPTRRECQYRHEEVDASILAAVRASEDDRGKLWAALHAVEGQVKWAAGLIITAFLGLIIYLMQGHIVP